MSPLHAVPDLVPDPTLCECSRPAGHKIPCLRRCSVEDCDDKHKAHGYCCAHLARWRRHGDPLGGHHPDSDLHIEDVEWMVEHGEIMENAAARLGRKPKSLERALERAGRRDLVARLKGRRESGAA